MIVLAELVEKYGLVEGVTNIVSKVGCIDGSVNGLSGVINSACRRFLVVEKSISGFNENADTVVLIK